MGKLPEAQKAFERARSRHNQDHLAKLYLGMVLGQDGDRPRGLREIEAGLRGLGDWLDDLERNLPGSLLGPRASPQERDSEKSGND